MKYLIMFSQTNRGSLKSLGHMDDWKNMQSDAVLLKSVRGALEFSIDSFQNKHINATKIIVNVELIMEIPKIKSSRSRVYTILSFMNDQKSLLKHRSLTLVS
jgi:hypothetical protein